MVVTNFGAAGFSDFRLSEKTTVYYYFMGLPTSPQSSGDAEVKEWVLNLLLELSVSCSVLCFPSVHTHAQASSISPLLIVLIHLTRIYTEPFTRKLGISHPLFYSPPPFPTGFPPWVIYMRQVLHWTLGIGGIFTAGGWMQRMRKWMVPTSPVRGRLMTHWRQSKGDALRLIGVERSCWMGRKGGGERV